jgi:hypothetical protein
VSVFHSETHSGAKTQSIRLLQLLLHLQLHFRYIQIQVQVHAEWYRDHLDDTEILENLAIQGVNTVLCRYSFLNFPVSFYIRK